MRTITRLLPILLLFVDAMHATAQNSSPLRTVDVVVLDEAGAPVTTLARESFTLREETEARDIRGFTTPDAPWNIVLLLDKAVTQSQTEGINRFIERMKPADRVAIALFGEQIEMVMDWKDRNARAPVLKLTPGISGATKDLHAAVRWAVEKLEGTKGRKAAIFITDGHDRRLAPQWLMNEKNEEILDPLFGVADWGEAEEFRRLNELVDSSEVRLYFLALPPDFGGRLIIGLYPGVKDAVTNYILKVRRRMERLTETSHGHVLYGNGLSEVIGAYERLYDTLRFNAIYTLEYAPAPESGPGVIQVQLKEQKLRALYSRNP